jgi:hypothetical protein
MMFEHTERAAAETADLLELIHDLETGDDAKYETVREHRRLALNVRLNVLPGNLSQRGEWTIASVTFDISDGGCRVYTERSVLVGDVYALDFGVPGMSPPLAICRRSQVFGDGVEAGMQFLEEVDVQAIAAKGAQGN